MDINDIPMIPLTIRGGPWDGRTIPVPDMRDGALFSILLHPGYYRRAGDEAIYLPDMTDEEAEAERRARKEPPMSFDPSSN